MVGYYRRPKVAISVAVIIFSILLSAIACSLTSETVTTDNRSRSEFTDKTDQKSIRVEIKTEMRKNQLHLKVQLDSGSISWSLKDPGGDILWQDSLNGKTKFNEKRNLPLIEGEWQLDISLENASGNYDIKWNRAK